MYINCTQADIDCKIVWSGVETKGDLEKNEKGKRCIKNGVKVKLLFSGLTPKNVSSSMTIRIFFFSVQVWKDYFPAVDAIVFLVDSCDRARFGESKVSILRVESA